MSEYPGEGGQSKWGLALKIGGIGCAVVVLLGAILGGFGVFQAVSCCSDLAEVAEVGNQASEWSYEFALALHENDIDEAKGFVRGDLRDRFASEIGEYIPDFQRGVPFPVEFRPIDDSSLDAIRTASLWQMSTLYFGHTEEEGVEFNFQVEAQRLEESALSFEVVSWEVRRRSRVLRDSRWAQGATSFNSRILQGREENLRLIMAAESPMIALSDEELRQKLDPLRAVVDEARAEVYSITPAGPHVAEVVLRFESLRDRQVREVGYLVTRHGQVYDFIIGDLVQSAPGSADPDHQVQEELEHEEAEQEEETALD